MQYKKWYTSKIMWANIISTVAIIAQSATGKEIISSEVQVVLLGIVNIALRIITKKSVEW